MTDGTSSTRAVRTPARTKGTTNGTSPNLSVISGIGQGYSLLNQTFPAASTTNFLVSMWNQLSFELNEAGSCTQ